MNLEQVLDLQEWLDGKTKWHNPEEWFRLLGDLLLEHLTEHEYDLRSIEDEKNE